MAAFRLLTTIYLALLVLLTGCQVHAPLHVWQPPGIESAIDKRVVIADIAGPKRITDRLTEQLLRANPKDSGRQLTIAHSSQLEQNDVIRMVSMTEDQPSDLALSTIARHEGFDYVLRGEVLKDSLAGRPDEPTTLKVSWRLTELGGDGTTGGKPVVVTENEVIKRYPDLAFVADKELMLITAAARDTYDLLLPSIQRRTVQLANPWLLPGSSRVRQANLLATNGDWEGAKVAWEEAAEKTPWQVGATHNLAFAAAAAQDFTSAKKHARRAVRLRPNKLHKETLRQIELLQRAYHNSFLLPAPPEGWFLTK